MEVTKCDRCGAYVDKPESEMPVIVYRFRDSDSPINNGTKRRHVCFKCYDEFTKWFDGDKEEENANND